jgi:hypothetical protein
LAYFVKIRLGQRAAAGDKAHVIDPLFGEKTRPGRKFRAF